MAVIYHIIICLLLKYFLVKIRGVRIIEKMREEANEMADIQAMNNKAFPWDPPVLPPPKKNTSVILPKNDFFLVVGWWKWQLLKGQGGWEQGNLIKLSARYQEGQKVQAMTNARISRSVSESFWIVMNKISWKIRKRVTTRYFHQCYKGTANIQVL